MWRWLWLKKASLRLTTHYEDMSYNFQKQKTKSFIRHFVVHLAIWEKCFVGPKSSCLTLLISFYWSAFTKQGKSAVMYFCLGYGFFLFQPFFYLILLWYFCFSLYTLLNKFCDNDWTTWVIGVTYNSRLYFSYLRLHQCNTDTCIVPVFPPLQNVTRFLKT